MSRGPWDPGSVDVGTADEWLRCAAVLEGLPGIPSIQYGSDLPARIRCAVADLSAHGECDDFDWVIAHVCERIAEPLVPGWFGYPEDEWTPDERAKIYAVREMPTAHVRGTAPPPETIALALSAHSGSSRPRRFSICSDSLVTKE